MATIKPDSKALTDVWKWREEAAGELANQTFDERNRRAKELAEQLGLRMLRLSDLARPRPDANQ